MTTNEDRAGSETTHCHDKVREHQTLLEPTLLPPVGRIGVAGAAAQRSQGKRSARMSSSDRAGLDGVKVRERQQILAFAEDFFRLPEVAALLDRGARFLYARFGEVIPEEDLLAAVGEKDDWAVSFPEAVEAAAESLLNEADSLLDSRLSNEAD